MNRRFVILAPILALVLLFAAPIAAAQLTLNLQPGDTGTVTCPTRLIAAPNNNGQSKTFTCEGTPAPTASPSGTPVPTPSPTVAPTATPSPVPTATATPIPPTPSPTPPITSSCAGTIVGYGSGTTGGSNTVSVSTFAALRTAAQAGGNRVVITGSNVLDGNGQSISPAANTTITRAPGSTAVLWDTWLLVRSSNVLLDDLVIRTGDDSVSVDADAISILAGSGQTISNIAINRVEAVFGPDVGGVTVLTNGGQLSNVTVQCSIIGQGLIRSTHPESGDADGHGLGMNISGIAPGSAPRNVSIHRNLITGNQSRNPRICGSDEVDVVNNVIYGYGEAPACNPQGLNYVNNLLRPGPQPEAIGLNEGNEKWRPVTSGDFPSLFTNSVWESGNVCDAEVTCVRGGPSSVYRTSPNGTISVPVAPTSGLLASVLSSVGPTTRDALTSQHVAEAQNRTGAWYNGAQGPEPRARPQ